MSYKKFGADRFSRFDVYWIQTNKQTNRQTDRQAKFIYRFANFVRERFYIFLHFNQKFEIYIKCGCIIKLYADKIKKSCGWSKHFKNVF